jgi:hypothetical protein
MSCSTATPTQSLIPVNLSLRASETVKIDNGAAQVTLYRVDNDSRCPTDVTCVSAGNATVVFSLIDTSCRACLPVQQFVNTTVEPRSVTVAGYQVRLDSLLPAPKSTRVIAQSDYVAYFNVSRAQP